MPYDFNEAKTIYENGFSSGNFDEMMAFAKYSIYEVGNTIGKTEKLMIKDLKEIDVNVITRYDSIHKSCLWAKKPLSKETTVIITEKEIENIKNVREDYRKVLFAALFLAKKDNNCNYYNRDIQDAIRLSGVANLFKENTNERADLLFFFKEWIPMIMGRSGRKVLYSCENGPSYLEINNKENPMKFFIKYCKKCQQPMIEKNRHGMHDLCYNEYRMEVLRKNSENYRKINKK